MRKIAILLGLLTAGCLSGATPGNATGYGGGPWCLRYDTGWGVVHENCSMPNFEVCARERINWGSTASCTQNPGFAGYYAPGPVYKKRRHHHHYH